MNNENFEIVKKNFISNYEQNMAKMDEYQQKMEAAIAQKNIGLVDFYKNTINTKLSKLKNQSLTIEFMRPTFETDIQERKDIFNYFPQAINQIIPDNIPYVFHGNKNIGMVLEIIKTGGLFTPEQRGVDFNSFASQIDVTYKNDVRVSCEFAEPNSYSFMPYGAIFVFTPLEEEIPNVLKTGGSEVSGGVSSVDFLKTPERLIGIITTEENKERIKNCCIQQNLNDDKVFTHNEFISKCVELFSNMELDYEVQKTK